MTLWDSNGIEIGEPVRTVEPAAMAVDPYDAIEHSRLSDISTEMATVERLLRAATAEAEEHTGLGLITQTLELRLSGFPAVITLPRRPLQSGVEIEYLDADGAAQILDPADYVVTGVGAQKSFGTVRPAFGKSWPSVREHPEAIKISFKVGFGDSSDDIPELIRHAIIVAAATWYDFREDVHVGNVTVAELPFASKALLSHWRRPAVA